MDPEIGEIPNGEVLVEDGVIVDVGPGLGVSDAEEIDATGMIVMPGFVDTHRHTWQTPVRGVLPSCTLDHYFAVMLGQVGGFYRPEDVHIGDYAGALEAVNGGVTTLLDWSHISNTPDHSDAAIQGLRDAGIRAVYAHGMPTGGEWWMLSELNHPEDIRRIRETYFSSDDGLLTLAMAARQPGNVNDDVAKHDWALARELGILISVHVGMRLHNLHYTPVKAMHDLGLMGPDVCYIHMTDLTDHEMDLIAETGGKASVAPYVEMLMGHGPPPIGKLLERGVRRLSKQQALLYAQTGHLCISTLHANNSYHALNRIINFFPYDARPALLGDLAVSLKAVISQRLVKAVDGSQVAAVEVLLNSKHIQELIVKGEMDQIKEAIEKSLSPGSVSFEQALFKLYAEGSITKDEALRNSDSATNLAWLMNNAEQAAARVGAKAPIRTEVAVSSFDDFKIDIHAGN